MQQRHNSEDTKAAVRQERLAARRAEALPPPPFLIPTSVLTIPEGTPVPSSSVYETLLKIDKKARLFREEVEQDGLTDFWKSIERGERTFLHLWKAEIQSTLRAPTGGLDVIRERQTCWRDYCVEGLAIEQELHAALRDWAVPSQMKSCLEAWSGHLIGGVHYMQFMVLILEEEIQDWRNEGQWNVASTSSVNQELFKVAS